MKKIINKSINNVIQFIIDESKINNDKEICGFLGYKDSKYIMQFEENISQDPQNHFLISPANFLKFKNEYSFLAIFHTHTKSDEKPSQFDIKISEACCLPFLIFSLESNKFYIYEPKIKDYSTKELNKIKEKFL
jgi:proteasome lid subunit RPN8/RPN11